MAGVLGNGMLTSAGAFWKRQRRIAQPAFHREKVRHFAPILSRMAADGAADWEAAAAAGDPVDAGTDMMRVTLRAVAKTLFGDDMAGDADEINRVFPTILGCLASRVSSPVCRQTRSTATCSRSSCAPGTTRRVRR